MKRILLILVVMLVGCGLNMDHCEEKATKASDTISVSEKQNVGEFLVYNYDYNKGKSPQWIKFNRSNIIEEHCGQIKLDDGFGGTYWADKYFFYSDIPDRYQKKRDEIESSFYGEISFNGGPSVIDYAAEEYLTIEGTLYSPINQQDIDRIAEAVVKKTKEEGLIKPRVIWDAETQSPHLELN